MTDPWDRGFGGGDPLLAQVGPLRASETDIDPNLYPLFAAGMAAADVHAAGIIHNDLHPANVMMSHLGQVTLVDLDDLVVTSLNPLAMAAEFLAPAGSLELRELIAFVAGYVKASYVCNDAIYAGYTEELLSVLGAVLLSAPVPRACRIDLLAFLSSLGLALVDGRLTAQGDAPLPGACSGVFALVLLILVVLGADASLLEERCFGAKARSPGDPRAGLLAKLWDRAMATRDATLESLVKHAGARFGELETNEAGLLQSNAVILRILGDIREIVSEEDLANIADIVVDILCSISSHYDAVEPHTPFARNLSVQSFQMAVIVYQGVVGAPTGEEAKRGYLQRVLQSFSWFKAWRRGVGVPADPNETNAPATLSARGAIDVLTCVDSLSLLLSRQFEVSCNAAESHPLLSHLMTAIDLGRLEFKLCAEILRVRPEGGDDLGAVPIDTVIPIIQHLCMRHGRLLQQLVSFALERCPALASLLLIPDTDASETLVREIKATMLLFDSVKAGSQPDLDAVRRNLNALGPYWRHAGP